MEAYRRQKAHILEQRRGSCTALIMRMRHVYGIQEDARQSTRNSELSGPNQYVATGRDFDIIISKGYINS